MPGDEPEHDRDDHHAEELTLAAQARDVFVVDRLRDLQDIRNSRTEGQQHSMAVDLEALVHGDTTLAVNLQPSMWAGAQERSGDADAVQAALFAQAVRDVGFVGFTFGGGHHFHNGVGIRAGTGRGSFNVRSYETSTP